MYLQLDNYPDNGYDAKTKVEEKGLQAKAFLKASIEC
jgi:hypothetical protein